MKVRFDSLTIREYPMELGDHPSCSGGAPVTIGWEPQATQTRNLELYEYTRTARRSRKQLHIPVQARAILLLKGGYSLQEIGNATHQVELARKERADTISSSHHGKHWKLVKMMLETTGKETLKMGGGLLSKVIKPVRKTVQARSA
jgi:hypothetical protein